MMRTRVLSVIVAIYVIGAASFASRMWRNGLLVVLLDTGVAGYLLLGYWIIALTAGSFGCIQLWRGHRAGRPVSIIFVACSLALDVALYLLADAGGVGQLPSAGVKGAVLLTLVYALPRPRQRVSKVPAA